MLTWRSCAGLWSLAFPPRLGDGGLGHFTGRQMISGQWREHELHNDMRCTIFDGLNNCLPSASEGDW